MQPSSVFAAATSRLHADLMIIRLKRAGISSGKISAIFPERLSPNAASCWLEGHSQPTLYCEETVTIAGPMRKALSTESETAFIRSLQRAGVGLNDACSYAERLGKGQILLCVNTDDQTEIALAWHTLRELEAEAISLGISMRAPERKSWFGRRTRDQHTHAVPNLSLGVAV